MITTIILLALLLLGIYILRNTYDYEVLGSIIVVIISLMLSFHIPSLFLKEYDYNMFIKKRNAFEQTLHDARENGNDLENATITKEILDWNVDLARRKYNNTTLLLNQYIDDRIMDLEPIK